jgi:hypothetical protein
MANGAPTVRARRVFGTLLLVVAAWSTLPAQSQSVTADSTASGAGPEAATPPDSLGIRPEHIWTTGYLRLVMDDTRAVLTAPAHWDEEQWTEATGALAGVGVTAVFDRTIRQHVQAERTPGEDRFMKHWQNINTFYFLAGFEVWGEIGGDTRAKDVAMDGIASTVIASGLITPGLKFVVGRVRPSGTPATFKFKPFTSNYSFPSGHATQAFAVATTIAEHYRAWWVEGLAYGSAALVGYARIEQNAHFASDVVAGSLIGWSVARAVVHRNNGPVNPKKLSWAPYAGGRGSGLVFCKSF